MIDLDIQNASKAAAIPDAELLQQWVVAALQGQAEAQLTVRIVDLDESAELNQRFRHKQGPTNVLSFAAELPPEIEISYLGDLVICAPLVVSEAAAQGKQVLHHWAHLVIHGVLHLLGHDHQHEAEAQAMEQLEISLLNRLGIDNPYEAAG